MGSATKLTQFAQERVLHGYSQANLFPDDQWCPAPETTNEPQIDALFSESTDCAYIHSHLEKLTPKALKRYSGLTSEFMGEAETAFAVSFKKVWMSKYHQYSSPDRFHDRIANLFNVDVSLIPALKERFQLPGVRYGASCTESIDSFTAPIYLNDDHDYVDAVETIMRKTFTRRRSWEIWGDYCSVYGRLSIDQIDFNDISYIVNTYPFSLPDLEKVFFVAQIEMKKYLEKHFPERRVPKSYDGKCAPIRVLLYKKHPRLRKITMRYAHKLYTTQAIPITRIAQKLEMDPTTLYNLGERVIGDWTLPSPETLSHAIHQTTLMHLI